MIRYTIKPGIACTGTRTPFERLPLKVRAAINKHFAVIFSMPAGQRGAYLSNLLPIVVEVSK